MTDVYRIGVSMAMTNNVSQVLGVIARDLLGVRGEIGKTEAAMSRLKGAMVGAGMVMAGGAILDGMGHLVEHGEKLVHQQALLKEGGLTQLDIATGTAAAWKATSDAIGSSVSDNLALVADLRNVLGDMPKAIAALPQMAQVGMVVSAGTGASPEKAGYSTAKYLEQRGALVNPVTEKIDPSRLADETRLIEAIAAATRFRVGPEQLLSFQTTARAAGSSLSDHGLKNLVPAIQAAKSPSNVGTQLASFEQQLLGGVMTKAGAEFFEQAGILDKKKVHVGRGGHLSIDKGAVEDADLLRSDPVAWVNTVLKNGLEKGFKDKTIDSQSAEIMRSHLRGTVVGLLVELIRNQAAFTKDAGLIDQAQKTDQYQAAQENDPTLKMKAFREAWDNLLTALGSPLVTPATDLLRDLAKDVTSLAQFAAGHPDGVRVIGELTTALGGLLVLGGSIKIMSVALGPFATGLRAMVGSLALASGSGATMSAMATGLSSLGGSLAAPAVLGAGASLAAVASGLLLLGAAVVGLPVLLKKITDMFPSGTPTGGRAAPTHGGGAYPAPPSGAPRSESMGEWWDNFKKEVTSAAHAGANQRAGTPIVATLKENGSTRTFTGVVGGYNGHDGKMSLLPAGMPAGGGN